MFVKNKSKNKKNIQFLVYGNFALNDAGTNGQATKTRNVYQILKNRYGDDKVKSFNIEKWKKHPLSIFFNLLTKLKITKNLIILPGANNLKFLLILLNFYLRKNNINVYYMVVGGWLADFVTGNKKSIKTLRLFEGIFVETKKLEQDLIQQGLKNIYYSPVFTLKASIDEESSKIERDKFVNCEEYPFCTFSRVTREKGIELAILAINQVRLDYGVNCTLDIFGAIDNAFKNDLNDLLLKYPFAKYRGFIATDQVISTLSKYFFLIFATYYPGEGFPATLLESNMASLPIIASDWKYNKEIVINKKTGYLFETKNITDLSVKIYDSIFNKEKSLEMRNECLMLSKNFSAEKALAPLFRLLDVFDRIVM